MVHSIASLVNPHAKMAESEAKRAEQEYYRAQTSATPRRPVSSVGKSGASNHISMNNQGWHRLEKYLKLEGFLEKSLKIKSALKRTGKSLRSLEKSLNSTIFCRT